jgi:hypothetical protein
MRRSRDFLGTHEVKSSFGSVSKQVELLSAIIDRISGFAVEQDASNRGYSSGTKTARELSRTLRKGYLRPVWQVGTSLFPNNPSIRQALKMPKSDDYEGLIAAANAMAERAAEHKEAFVTAGFGEDFVELVRGAAVALRKALDEREQHLGLRASASAGLIDQVAKGRGIMRLLDTLVSQAWAGTPELLARWKTLSRFDKPAPVPVVVAGGTPVVAPAVPVVVAPVVTAPVGPAGPSSPTTGTPVLTLPVPPSVASPAGSGGVVSGAA